MFGIARELILSVHLWFLGNAADAAGKHCRFKELHPKARGPCGKRCAERSFSRSVPRYGRSHQRAAALISLEARGRF
jgi:hypothetical protein